MFLFDLVCRLHPCQDVALHYYRRDKWFNENWQAQNFPIIHALKKVQRIDTVYKDEDADGVLHVWTL